MNIICFGQQNWAYCWTGKQQLSARLARMGHRVLYIDPQPEEEHGSREERLRATAPSSTGSGVRRVAPRLYVFTFRHAPFVGWRLNERRRPRALSGAARRLGFHSPVALALHPNAAPLLECVRPAARVYYAVDEASAFGGMAAEERRRIRRAEELLLRKVHVALAISPRLLRRLSGLHPRTYLLESGADVERFAPHRLERIPPHPALNTVPRPRLGYVGQLDERLDQPLLVGLARARRDWQIVLTGRVKPGVDVSGLHAEPNIHLLGYQAHERLPGILRQIDVCIAPYQLNELTHSCSPLKVFEYLATGRPVVATPLEGLRAYSAGVRLAAGPVRFRRAVAAALVDPAAGRPQRLSLARANSWEHRAERLEQHLAEAVVVARSVGPDAGTYLAGIARAAGRS